MSEANSFETAMRKQYSNYYIIIDRDNISRAEFEHIQREANQRQNVELIFSNVAFEVWLLAHYQNMTARPVDADTDNARYRRVLSNCLNEPYKKGNSVQLDRIISSAEHPIETAFNNTSAIQELSYDNQCTNVGPFLRQLVANR
ncbi:RloB domain-containing protein [Veillonella atypica]|uniref:RloB domain-containing protein n=2 Tax=Veillonella atypica TaxID=39777 RepID=A0A3A6WAD1_9FIRM|nr:RloB domain-containing protein [Veillonella atypica]